MIPEKIDITDKREHYQFTAYVGNVYSDMVILGQYNNAINILIKELKASRTRVDLVSYPLLYLMRHSMELGYKRNFDYLEKYSNRITSTKLNRSHNLKNLHVELKEHFNLISASLFFDQEIINEFKSYYNSTTKFISHLEPSESSAFRYSKNISGHRIFKNTATIDIAKLKVEYDKAINLLVHTANVISPYTDYKDLIDKRPDLKDGIGIVLMTFPSNHQQFYVDKLDEKYEKLNQLLWKDNVDDQVLRIISVGETCYLTPMVK